MLTFFANPGDHTGIFVEIIFFILTLVIDKQVFLLENQRQDLSLTVLKIRCQLNGASRPGFFAQTALDAACKVKSKPFSIAPPAFSFGRVHGDAADRANRRTQVTGHAAFSAVRIPGQNDAGPAARRQRTFVFRIFFRDGLSEEMLKCRCKAGH